MGDYTYIQVFNILMRKCLGFLKLQLVGRNFFDAAAKVDIYYKSQSLKLVELNFTLESKHSS